MEDTASLLSQNAAAGVELTCLVDPALPAQVSGDPTRIRQVVSNLLSNALKFTRLGRVDVRVEATAEGVRISVRDTGIGIAQEALDRIFQRSPRPTRVSPANTAAPASVWPSRASCARPCRAN